MEQMDTLKICCSHCVFVGGCGGGCMCVGWECFYVEGQSEGGKLVAGCEPLTRFEERERERNTSSTITSTYQHDCVQYTIATTCSMKLT